MSGLRELQRAMRAALHDGAPDALLQRVAQGGLPPEARLEVYAQMYYSRQVQALAEDFPLVRRLAGPVLFDRLAITQVKRRPSAHPSLAWLGDGFEETLRSLDLDAEAAVARLEWARVQAFWSADATLLSAPELGALGERLAETALTLHPSLRLVEVVAGVLEIAAGAGPELLEPGRSQQVVVWRKQEAIREVPLQPMEAEALRRAGAGQTVASICEAFVEAPDPGAAALRALVEWVNDGWLCRS
jgi:hypothetical protein